MPLGSCTQPVVGLGCCHLVTPLSYVLVRTPCAVLVQGGRVLSHQHPGQAPGTAHGAELVDCLPSAAVDGCPIDVP